MSSIGGVNELAVSQYEEVKENYKHLATRIYELEKEKLSIMQFMNELDKRKLDAFMKSFNQVSQSFNEIFSTVTSGAGRLFLEDPEKPFEAGADIRLQFPGKAEMAIGSASDSHYVRDQPNTAERDCLQLQRQPHHHFSDRLDYGPG